MGRPLPTALPLALDGAEVAPFLGELVRDAFGPRTRVRGVTSEVLKRRTVRYTVELEGARVPGWRLVGKVYETRAAGEAGLAAQRWLWQRGFAVMPPERIVVPRVLGFFPELGLVLMEEAGGRSLQHLLNVGQACADDLRGLADVLVKLHRFPLTYGPPFTLDQHLEQRCRGQAWLLASEFPDLAPSIDRIVAQARGAEGAGLRAGYTLAHGDYHPGQVQVDRERLWLIDTDLLHQGDPAYDVAMAVVRLKGLGTRQGREEHCRVLLELFLGRYFSGMERSIAERVPLAAALVFLKRACKRFFWQDEPAWPDAVRLQMARAEECLDLRERTTPARDLAGAIALCAACPPAD